MAVRAEDYQASDLPLWFGHRRLARKEGRFEDVPTLVGACVVLHESWDDGRGMNAVTQLIVDAKKTEV